MAEPETRALVARLTQAWGVKDSGAGAHCQFENRHFRFECGLAPQVYLRVVGQSNTANAAMIQWQRCELVHSEGKLKKYTPVSVEAEEWRETRAFITAWWPHLRRGCFLSGLPLQHSAREERQWLGWYHEQGGSDRHLDLTSRRVCAAFGMQTFELQLGLDWVEGHGHIEGEPISWRMRGATGELVVLNCGQGGGDFSGFKTGDGTWMFSANFKSPQHAERVARALYCLGFEDEYALSQLPPLSMHEKLELRLSLPREFWPEKWIGEEVG